MSDTSRFRFFFSDGAQVVGPVQGAGGFLSDVAILRASLQLASEGKPLARVYEPKPQCVACFPDFSAADNGPAYIVDLRDVVRIEPQGVPIARKLTEPMRSFLLLVHREGRASGWDAGSTTVGACKRAAFVTPIVTTETDPSGKKRKATVYELTDSGRAAIGVTS